VTGAQDHDHPHVADELARRAAQVEKGAARAAVLGVNDGLVTNVCLILAVAGAQVSRAGVRLAGFASLIAGACSMAAGEWVSIRAQVDLYRGVLSDLRRIYVSHRPAVFHQLVHRFERNGLDADTASTAASEIIGDDRRGVEVSARLLVGINPEELGSPWIAATTSLLLFAAGALVPLLPWFFVGGTVGVTWSIALTVVAGAIVGGFIGAMSSEPVWRSALRQVFIVVLASSVTFGIGRLLGTTVG
jgi:VIT1/CCC1 family predicted Fe2+/Mn2+ transporter